MNIGSTGRLSKLALASLAASLLGLVAPPPSADIARGTPAEPPEPGQTRAPLLAPSAYVVRTAATGLDHPWGLQFLPSGRMLVTERPGRLRIVGPGGVLSPAVAGLPKLDAQGQAGLLDLAIDPGFPRNGLIFLSYVEPRAAGAGVSVAVARLAEGGGARLVGLKVIFRAKPAAIGGANFGSRLAFGADGRLYVTVGDRFALRDQAQDLASDLGKVVRIAADGAIPPDNPFVHRKGARPEIWTLGHRNPQGLAIQAASGAMFELEHGAKGGDEINILQRGHDYGWPVITYGVDYSGAKIGIGTHRAGMDQPVYYWDPSIAPSGMTFYDGKLFAAWRGDLIVGALKAQDIRRLVLRGDRVVGEEILLPGLGERVRDVREGPDGALYVLTDETSGRILKLTPAK